jgi:hypothetical protein
MKLEGDQIVIRVGGGYLTIDEFVQIYCYGEEASTKRQMHQAMDGCDERGKYKAYSVKTTSRLNSVSP